jgi:hypothetical protein
MKRKINIITFLVLFLTQQSAMGQNARLSDITITNTHDDLELVYLKVKGTFTEKMKEAVSNGVPITFLFFVTLHKIRRLWGNEEIANIQITHTLKYDNLKKEFIIKRSWEDDEPIIAKSFEEARKLMSEINRLKIVPLNRLEKGERYQLKAKAELSKVTLPVYLHYILVFMSLWDFETDWYSIEFVY